MPWSQLLLLVLLLCWRPPAPKHCIEPAYNLHTYSMCSCSYHTIPLRRNHQNSFQFRDSGEALMTHAPVSPCSIQGELYSLLRLDTVASPVRRTDDRQQVSPVRSCTHMWCVAGTWCLVQLLILLLCNLKCKLGRHMFPYDGLLDNSIPKLLKPTGPFDTIFGPIKRQQNVQMRRNLPVASFLHSFVLCSSFLCSFPPQQTASTGTHTIHRTQLELLAERRTEPSPVRAV